MTAKTQPDRCATCQCYAHYEGRFDKWVKPHPRFKLHLAYPWWTWTRANQWRTWCGITFIWEAAE